MISRGFCHWCISLDVKCDGAMSPFSTLQEQTQTPPPRAAAYWSLSGYDVYGHSDNDGEERQQRDSHHLSEEGGARKMKYVVVTGGVVSGLGKGITASSIGVVLKACGLRITSIKIGEVGGREGRTEGQREPLGVRRGSGRSKRA